MTRFAAVLIASFTLAFFTPDAIAQMPNYCQPYNKIKEYLEKKRLEVLIAQGLAGNSLMQLFANKSGEWSVLIMRPEMPGIGCIQGAGTDFELTGNEFPPDKPKVNPS